jgi:oxygen-independent coproporphyrinogen-3 oxidase
LAFPRPEDRQPAGGIKAAAGTKAGGAEISLYLHIPFCEAKCDYCDFYSVPTGRRGSAGWGSEKSARTDALLNRYIDVLVEETRRRFDEARRASGPVLVPTLYIGGGTPSVLGAAGIGRLLDGLLPVLGPGCREITVEANPESAGAAFLRACADRGVNRLSLGIQSFSGPARRAAGRRGAPAPENLAAASEIFGSGLSLDLMTGLPRQSVAGLLAGIDRAVSLRPGHISLYSLTVEEGTPLAGRLGQAGSSGKADSSGQAGSSGQVGSSGKAGSAGQAALPSVDQSDRLWLAGRDALLKAGYEQYEVSNFALPGKRCAHNIRYWLMEDWIGIGCAASGTIIGKPEEWPDEEQAGKEQAGRGGAGGRRPDIRGRRSGYAPDLKAFLADPASCISVEELDRLTLIKESLLMGFRYVEGPSPELFKRRFGLGVEEAVPRTLEKWRGADPRLLRRDGKTALTADGLLLLNRFLLDCFEEL